MPDEPTFDSIDALEKHFGKLKKAAGDDEAKVREIDLEMREAKADFREKAALFAALDAHRTKVLATAGIPEDFHEWVVGDTTEQIDASAAKVKERLEKLSANAPNAAADALYGTEPIRPGGGTPPPPRQSDRQKRIHESEVKINADTSKRAAARATRQDGRPASVPELTAAEYAQYGQDILGRQVAHAWFRNSQNPTVQKLYDPSKID